VGGWGLGVVARINISFDGDVGARDARICPAQKPRALLC
jgi:hypothetical protein